MSETSEIGIIGLGVMGTNLALNLQDARRAVAVFDLSPDKVKAASQGAPRVHGQASLSELVAALERPRRILLMVPAGDPVDAVLAQLGPLLDAEDIVIDGGNEHFEATEARQARWAERQIHLVGMGVSGGAEGARTGPSLMPGGASQAYQHLRPVLEDVAAQVEDGPCVTHIGPGGAGHFVKMVHNGIEYADMQLIAEVYDLLRNVGGLDADALADVFATWNEGELESFLVEITARILRAPDDRGEGRLVDAILDTAKMKGTGSWTVTEGAKLPAPIPTLASAVEARLMSGFHPLRQRAAERLGGPSPAHRPGDAEALVADAREALYAGKLVAYAQGLDLLARASEARQWGLELAEIARIWKAGCIIRARLLGQVQAAFTERADLPNLLLDPHVTEAIRQRQGGLRRTASRMLEHGVAAPALMSAIAYYDGLRRGRLPANLTQAQRDLFGAHGFQRLDAPGDTVRAEW